MNLMSMRIGRRQHRSRRRSLDLIIKAGTPTSSQAHLLALEGSVRLTGIPSTPSFAARETR